MLFRIKGLAPGSGLVFGVCQANRTHGGWNSSNSRMSYRRSIDVAGALRVGSARDSTRRSPDDS